MKYVCEKCGEILSDDDGLHMPVRTLRISASFHEDDAEYSLCHKDYKEALRVLRDFITGKEESK